MLPGWIVSVTSAHRAAELLEPVDGATVTPLWTTTEAGGVLPPGGSVAPESPLFPTEDDLAPRTLAVAIEPGEAAGGATARLIVVADSNLLEDQFIRANPQNLDFVANAVDWLVQDETLIDIRSKDRMPPPLVFASDTSKNLLKWGCMVGIPLVLVLAGFLRVSGRQKRARTRWEGALS